MCEFRNASVKATPEEWGFFEPRLAPYCTSENDAWFEFTLSQLLRWWWTDCAFFRWPRTAAGELGTLKINL